MSDESRGDRARPDPAAAPRRLYERAKRFGDWNPSDISFGTDVKDWRESTSFTRRLLMAMTGQFGVADSGVTVEIIPLLSAMARAGRNEDVLYLTTFAYEEGKHTDFFTRWVRTVTGDRDAIERAWRLPAWHQMFAVELPAAMARLQHDPAPEDYIRAIVTYHVLLESVLAHTGYHFLTEAIGGRFPGLAAGLKYIQQDESRHVSYGVSVIGGYLQANPAYWTVVEAEIRNGWPLIERMLHEPPPGTPAHIRFARSRLTKTVARLRRHLP